jgi:polysaccharide pyruvyl transferase WcaK-like protein
MRIVVIHGYTDSNKGDVAIAHCTVAAIRALAPEAEILFHSNYREDHADFAYHNRFSRQAGIPVSEGLLPSPYVEDAGKGGTRGLLALLRLVGGVLALPLALIGIGGRRRALRELASADVILARGGQYLHNESGRVRGLIYLWRMLMNIAVPVWMGKRVVILGMSIGPLHGGMARWMAARVLRGCDLMVVREQYSADLLASLGITRQVRIAHDMAFLTDPAADAILPDLIEMGARYIGVTVIRWNFPGYGDEAGLQGRYLAALIGALGAAYQQFGLTPLLVEQVTARHHGMDDSAAVDALEARLRETMIPCVRVAADAAPEELAAIYGRCEVVLATRLHSLILAACAGTPSVAIRYQGTKTQGIMEALGTGEYVFDIAAVSSEELSGAISGVLADREGLSRAIRTRVAGFRGEIMQAAADALGMPDAHGKQTLPKLVE